MADFSVTSSLQFCSMFLSQVAVAKLKFMQGPYKHSFNIWADSFWLCSPQNVSKVSSFDNETLLH